MTDTVPPVQRAKRGRFVSTRCPDPNCGGALVILEDGWWCCDGLTHEGDDGELEACRHMVEA
jgi:hypothetical protein